MCNSNIELDDEISECPFCFEQRECSTFPVFVNHDDETVWMNGCDDCIAYVNPEYAQHLGLITIAQTSEAIAHV